MKNAPLCVRCDREILSAFCSSAKYEYLKSGWRWHNTRKELSPKIQQPSCCPNVQWLQQRLAHTRFDIEFCVTHGEMQCCCVHSSFIHLLRRNVRNAPRGMGGRAYRAEEKLQIWFVTPRGPLLMNYQPSSLLFNSIYINDIWASYIIQIEIQRKYITFRNWVSRIQLLLNFLLLERAMDPHHHLINGTVTYASIISLKHDGSNTGQN